MGNVTNKELYQEEEIILPSHGYLYDDKIPEGKIFIRPMTTREEKLLAGSRGKATVTFNTLLKRCITKPEFDPLDLLISDRFFIFIAIRWLTYGSDYTFKLTCPSCSIKFMHTLDVKTGLTIDNLEEGAIEPFPLELPYSKIKLGLRQLRGFDEEAIENYTKSQLKKIHNSNQGDVSYEFRMAKTIVTIGDNDVNLADTISFVDGMHGGDSSAIRNKLEENTSGVNPTFDVTCQSCSHEFEQNMPFTSEFFRSGH